MNANYIYDIFETTEKNDAPDLNVGLAMLRAEKPIPADMDGADGKELREFMGRHYQKLVAAYRAKDRYVFAAVVKACEAEDEEKDQETQV